MMRRYRIALALLLVLVLGSRASAQISKVLNTAAQLAGKTLATIEGAWTVTGLWTFDRDPNPPFAVTSGSAKVSNLDADLLDGQTDTYYTKWQVVSYTSTGTQNNVDFSLTGSRNAVVFANPASALTITGIVAGFDGQQILILNKASAIVVDFAHASGSSSAGNKLTNIATSGNTPTSTGGFAKYVYDATSTVWRLTMHEQGAWITPTFAAGNFTATGGTWTVGSGDVTMMKYRLVGRTLHIAFATSLLTISAGPVTQLSISNGQWGSFTSVGSQWIALCLLSDNGTLSTNCYMQTGTGASATAILISRAGANFTAATDNSSLWGEMLFELS